jgi:hypothetical protein
VCSEDGDGEALNFEMGEHWEFCIFEYLEDLVKGSLPVRGRDIGGGGDLGEENRELEKLRNFIDEGEGFENQDGGWGEAGGGNFGGIEGDHFREMRSDIVVVRRE